MKSIKVLPALLASLAAVPVHAQSDVGRLDQSAQKQLYVDLKSCAKPIWPKESLRREETGKVTLEYLVGLDGKVLESKVLKSSGFPLLDLAAQDGLAKCQFSLPSSIGRSEPTRTRMQYVWTLDGNGPTPAQRLAEWQRYVAKAVQGNAESQARAGMGYLYGQPPIEKNPAEGLRWLRAAAEQGNARGMVALAHELQTGVNTARDAQQALDWLEQAAAQGADYAEFGLAMALMGPSSVRPDEARARTLLERVLAGGNKAAKMPLAFLMLKEAGGNSPEGVRLMQEAADEHDRVAQFMLAQAHEKGEQVVLDRAKALALYERAAAAGLPLAREKVARLKQQTGK